jgi:phosphatidylethanolamine/phosphatidyl-N-methylethanolamine N-methyltransferase
MRMTNRWNQFIYRIWAPIYDAALGHFFMPGRKRALELLNLKPGEKVLLVGIGTGADLPFMPAGVDAIGVDLVLRCSPKPASNWTPVLPPLN